VLPLLFVSHSVLLNNPAWLQVNKRERAGKVCEETSIIMWQAFVVSCIIRDEIHKD
jgi:hypothetical protein